MKKGLINRYIILFFLISSVFEQQLLLVQDQDKDPEQAFQDAVDEARGIYDLEYLF